MTQVPAAAGGDRDRRQTQSRCRAARVVETYDERHARLRGACNPGAASGSDARWWRDG